MSALVALRSALIGGIVATGPFLTSAIADGNASTEKVFFRVADAFEPGAAVVGTLRIPASTRGALPAVLIVNSSPGFDGRGAFYAEALNGALIATLEIDMFQGRGIPATPRHNLPHAFETLKYLATHPRVDPARIGIMGFSWGGIIAVLASSEELTRQYGDRLRFAAHLGVYPICWRHRTFLAGSDKHFRPTIYRRVTGSPVHILSGSKDDYDNPDDCPKFLAELPDPVRRDFSLTVYPDATFGWDSRFSSAQYDAAARNGKGGIVNVVADAEVADQSRGFAVSYFTTALGEVRADSNAPDQGMAPR